MCLYCENKGTKDFKTGEAVRTHMLNKGHCFMSKSNFDEYVGFYDFTTKEEENIEEDTADLNKKDNDVEENVEGE